MRTAGPLANERPEARRVRALERIRGGWRRRAGATGMLLAMIAVTIVVAG